MHSINPSDVRVQNNPLLFLMGHKVPDKPKDWSTLEQCGCWVSEEWRLIRANGFSLHSRLLSYSPPHLVPPSFPGVMKKPALDSAVKTALQERITWNQPTMLNCDAWRAVHLIFPEPLTVYNGQWTFHVVFISVDNVVINLLFCPSNKLSGKACLHIY